MAAFLLLAAALVTLLSGQWTCLVGHYPKDQLGPSGQRMMSVSSHRTLQGFRSQTSFLCGSVVYTHTHKTTHTHTHTHTLTHTLWEDQHTQGNNTHTHTHTNTHSD